MKNKPWMITTQCEAHTGNYNTLTRGKDSWPSCTFEHDL